jgi:hypothetical protein
MRGNLDVNPADGDPERRDTETTRIEMFSNGVLASQSRSWCWRSGCRTLKTQPKGRLC